MSPRRVHVIPLPKSNNIKTHINIHRFIIRYWPSPLLYMYSICVCVHVCVRVCVCVYCGVVWCGVVWCVCRVISHGTTPAKTPRFNSWLRVMGDRWNSCRTKTETWSGRGKVMGIWFPLFMLLSIMAVKVEWCHCLHMEWIGVRWNRRHCWHSQKTKTKKQKRQTRRKEENKNILVYHFCVKQPPGHLLFPKNDGLSYNFRI